MLKLHGYFRSSAAFRARIALNLKGLAYEQAFIHLRKNEQRAPGYLARNPRVVFLRRTTGGPFGNLGQPAFGGPRQRFRTLGRCREFGVIAVVIVRQGAR